MWAAAGGHAGIIRELMGQAADAAIRDVRARGALHWAAEKGHVEAVDLLVEKLSELGLDLHAQVRGGPSCSGFLPPRIAQERHGNRASNRPACTTSYRLLKTRL